MKAIWFLRLIYFCTHKLSKDGICEDGKGRAEKKGTERREMKHTKVDLDGKEN